MLRIGTASWSIPRDFGRDAAPSGSRLERYAARFTCVEINSSFYKPHRRSTYERWAASVPPGFSFSVKVPKAVTHERRLIACSDELDRFGDEIAGLGDKLGPILVQMPPSLAFDEGSITFLDALRARFTGPIVCEPRHRSWLAPDADDALRAHAIARVAADPAISASAAVPGGSGALVYVRLHGAPRTYWSGYDEAGLHRWLRVAQTAVRPCDRWIVFDNTAAGAAWSNAQRMMNLATGSVPDRA